MYDPYEEGGDGGNQAGRRSLLSSYRRQMRVAERSSGLVLTLASPEAFVDAQARRRKRASESSHIHLAEGFGEGQREMNVQRSRTLGSGAARAYCVPRQDPEWGDQELG